MEKDKNLEELFLSQKPHFDDSEAFMESLTKRLDAVEFVKQYQEQSLRRYKIAVVLAFVMGVASGCVAMVSILSVPVDLPLFNFHGHLLWLAENSRLITVTALSLLMGLGVYSIIGNVIEILNMRDRYATSHVFKE